MLVVAKERQRKRDKKGRKGGKNESTKWEKGGTEGARGRKKGGPFYNCKALAARAKRGLLNRKIKAIGRENKCE